MRVNPRTSLYTAMTIGIMNPEMAMARMEPLKLEGVAVFARGSINPPSPFEGCDKAKSIAKGKAIKAGYTGRTEWDHLSRDSDCMLKTTRAGTAGYLYTFTAKGTFYR